MEREQTFASWLKQQRKALDLTQSDTARLFGCAVVTLQKIEQGRRRPSKQMAELLAHHLEIAPDVPDAFLGRARAEPSVSRCTPSTPVSRIYIPTPPTGSPRSSLRHAQVWRGANRPDGQRLVS